MRRRRFARSLRRTLRRASRQAWRRLRRAPAGAQAAVALLLVAVSWLLLNGVYQVLRKPAELFYPVSGVLAKTPVETWQAYAPIFRAHSTAVITPELLAALAQVEASGNPVATPAWRWRLTPRPFDVYRPASSAVGMYQITDGAFVDARRYCIHRHVVAEDGPWDDWRSCWFNAFYSRLVPSHAAEMTAAFLDRRVAQALSAAHVAAATLRDRQKLAALIHLCGGAAGEAYAKRGFRLAPGQRCGEHDAAAYLARVQAMERVFARLRARPLL